MLDDIKEQKQLAAVVMVNMKILTGAKFPFFTKETSSPHYYKMWPESNPGLVSFLSHMLLCKDNG